jgi:hypothetical protein
MRYPNLRVDGVVEQQKDGIASVIDAALVTV